MVEVGCGGRHATAGEHAGAVAGLDKAALGGGGASSGGSGIDEGAGVGVGDGPSPLRPCLVLRDLAGDVGDDGPVPGQVTGVVVELDESGEVNVDVDDTVAGCRRGAAKKVQ